MVSSWLFLAVYPLRCCKEVLVDLLAHLKTQKDGGVVFSSITWIDLSDLSEFTGAVQTLVYIAISSTLKGFKGDEISVAERKGVSTCSFRFLPVSVGLHIYNI